MLPKKRITTFAGGKYRLVEYETQTILGKEEWTPLGKFGLPRVQEVIEADRVHRVLAGYDKRVLWNSLRQNEKLYLQREAFSRYLLLIEKIIKESMPAFYASVRDVWHVIKKVSAASGVPPSFANVPGKTSFYPYPEEDTLSDEPFPADQIPRMSAIFWSVFEVRRIKDKSYPRYLVRKDVRERYLSPRNLGIDYMEDPMQQDELYIFAFERFEAALRDHQALLDKGEAAPHYPWWNFIKKVMGDVMRFSDDDAMFSQVLERQDWDCPLRERHFLHSPFGSRQLLEHEFQDLYQSWSEPYDKDEHDEFNRTFDYMDGEKGSMGHWVLKKKKM